MAEAEAAATGAAGILEKKIGPLPVAVWAIAAVGVWWWVRRSSGASGATTDPAGNVGTIDPATGYVYGSSQDSSALAARSGGSGTDTTGTTSGATVAGQYADNNAWSRAAVNYLVGLGVDPATANQAVTKFMASQPLTANEQADLNLAIQALGAPPTLPGPVDTSPSPVKTPPSPSGPTGSGVVYAANPPTGLRLTATGTQVKATWNRVKNATGYDVTISQVGTSKPMQSRSIGPEQTSYTFAGLHRGVTYKVTVVAYPGQHGAPAASATARTR